MTNEQMAALWEQHLGAEFGAKNTDMALDTMSDHPSVNQVPLAIGGVGREGVADFYSRYFLSQTAPDTEMVPVSRTIGQGRLVDEMVIRFTHSVQMDWILPGIPPTGKRIELAMVAIIQFEHGKIAHERLYWDQACLMMQVGLIDPSLPALGAESAQRVLDPSLPMNALIHRAEKR